MSITAAQVKELRELSGAGMMDCKAALAETSGDLEAAIDWLRKKGVAKADKKAGRMAAEGLIGVASGDKSAVLVEVNSETDFVARNGVFQDIVRNVATAALGTSGGVDAVSASFYPGSEKTVEAAIKDAIGTIGENMAFRRSAKLSVEEGVVAAYIHNSVTDGLGKLGVLVAIETTGNKEVAASFGRQIAMHIAAVNPLAITEQDVDSAVVEREREIFLDQARQSGKPESIIEKMVEGRVRKFYEEVVLLSQAFVVNPDVTVGVALKGAEESIGAPARITGFVRFALGDGVEREETDFASEVAAAAKG
ncbi:translation elongation factor Ts [Bartonella sp. CB178]|uniref:translation elongation factor Ts n=1 Tax=Bartonella sp. CB178 TaxID=3112255 RepID=UPI00300E3BF4